MAICYPDAYEVGMSHLGSRVLYEVANRRDDTACERAFVPWPDKAEALRESGELLTTLETKTPLRELDIVGITLQHELNYPGIVRLLELGGIAAWARERSDDAPIVIGGGPCAAAPEPVAPFFDAIAIGDGEETLGDIIDAVVSRPEGDTRESLLKRLSEIPGVYVPLLYEPDANGRPTPIADAPAAIQRRVVESLDDAPYPTRPIVPFLEIVHDRAQLEINRGCTHGCRFCQAGMLYRPVRERSLKTLKRLSREILDSTGYEQISLSSLSCTDYPHIVELVDAVAEGFGDKYVSISLPSLRTDQFGIELAQRVSRAKKSPITLAPEAGSQRLRDVINKNVSEENLHEAARAGFRGGWHSIKLYFMIGLPTETDEDILAIAATVSKLAEIGREELGQRKGRLRIPVTISGFVPKPHSVFEGQPQCPPGELERKHRLLMEAIRDRAVQLKFSPPGQTVLEGVLARGGRDLAPVIYRVAHVGEALESWHEWFSQARWESAFAEQGTSSEAEMARTMRDPAAGPWGHIDTGITAEFRRREVELAEAGQTTPDCREGHCSACGLQECCDQAQAPAASTAHGIDAPPTPPPPRNEDAPPFRALIEFAKGEAVRYVSHLDVSRALQRAARRAGLPMAYTQGFNQRPRMTIARPLSVGVTGDAEPCAIELWEAIDPKEMARALSAQLPEGFALRSVAVVPRRGRSPLSRSTRALYHVLLTDVTDDALEAALAELLARPAIEIDRETKRGRRTVDIRPGVLSAEMAEGETGLELDLICTDEDLVKPEEVVEAIGRELTAVGRGPASVRQLHRRRLVLEDQADRG